MESGFCAQLKFMQIFIWLICLTGCLKMITFDFPLRPLVVHHLHAARFGVLMIRQITLDFDSLPPPNPTFAEWSFSSDKLFPSRIRIHYNFSQMLDSLHVFQLLLFYSHTREARKWAFSLQVKTPCKCVRDWLHWRRPLGFIPHCASTSAARGNQAAIKPPNSLRFRCCVCPSCCCSRLYHGTKPLS